MSTQPASVRPEQDVPRCGTCLRFLPDAITAAAWRRPMFRD